MADSMNRNATGQMLAREAVVYTITLVATGAPGSVVLRDGGVGGTVMHGLTAAGAGDTVSASFKGMQFSRDVHATIANGIVYVEYT